MTFWEVRTPPKRPLSLMLHLRDNAGKPIAIGDGLGFPVEDWQQGDVFVQNHILSLPPDMAEGDYGLFFGAYWLENVQTLSPSQVVSPLNLTIIRR